MRNDRTYINEPYMQQSRHDDGRMTKEQAVKWVKFVYDVLYEDKDEEIREALDMAIEALSADAVDCTDFIEWLVDRVLDETIWENNSVAYGEIICRKLEKLGVLEVTEEPSYYIRPSADAVQGEWIVREYCTNELDYRRWIEIECPFCGEKPTYENLDNMNFCPNCGAKMCKGGDLE